VGERHLTRSAQVLANGQSEDVQTLCKRTPPNGSSRGVTDLRARLPLCRPVELDDTRSDRSISGEADLQGGGRRFEACSAHRSNQFERAGFAHRGRSYPLPQ